MTFDDGIIKFYAVENIAKKGDKPDYKLRLITCEYVKEETLGINRYFTALANKRRIERVVAAAENRLIEVNMIAVDEADLQYNVVMVQHSVDEYNLKICRISLERVDSNYEFTKCS